LPDHSLIAGLGGDAVHTGMNRLLALAFSLGMLTQPALLRADWQFSEVSEEAGAAHVHGYLDTVNPGVKMMAGGVAAGDYDQDGDTDLYLVTGDSRPNALLRNNGNGSFTELAATAGVGLSGHISSGPTFADINADGWPDLLVGGVAGAGYHVFRNNSNGTFDDVTEASGITQSDTLQNDYSSALGDPDRDGDLDLFIAHWGANVPTNHLWINRGQGQFVAADEWAGIDVYLEDDWTFAPTFSDINADGIQDLLITGDYNTSEVLMCDASGLFSAVTTDIIDDENGMGSAVADFDNDGDMDWFVSSIWDARDTPTWGGTGNRLYFNDGDGNFVNVTEQAGVEVGHWGWGSCAADFNNDGWLDIFHVNGFPSYGPNQTDFRSDRSVLYISNRDGSFTERSAELNINETLQGRGVSCFDYDADGDIDIFTANWEGPSRLYRNDLDENPGYLQIRLLGETNEPSAIGARIQVTTDGLTQTREITAGSNYTSQNPLDQHFGLDGAGTVDELRVAWPHGGETVMKDVAPNQLLTLNAAQSSPAPFALEPGISAAWYDPSHEGEGFMLEILPGNRAVMYWFTYTAEGEQDWYIAVGDVTGRRILFPELLTISGGTFGPGFDASQVSEAVVGSAAFSWDSCSTGRMDWVIGDQQGRLELQRLSSVMGLGCGIPTPGVPPAPEHVLSGSWYDPARSGEGYTLEILADGRVLVYWFSFDPDSNRRWFFGVGSVEDGDLVFTDMLTTRGGGFGEDFDPATVEGLPWGSLELELDCNTGIASYASTEAGFGAGQLELVRLSTLWGLACP